MISFWFLGRSRKIKHILLLIYRQKRPEPLCVAVILEWQESSRALYANSAGFESVYSEAVHTSSPACLRRASLWKETKIDVINDPESVPKRLSSDNFNLIKA